MEVGPRELKEGIDVKLTIGFDKEKYIEVGEIEMRPDHKEGLATVILYWRFSSHTGSPYCQSTTHVKFPVKHFSKLSEMIGQAFKADEFFKKLKIKTKEDT